MLRVESFVLQGIDAVPCEIEADLTPAGLPRTTVVGLPDAAVRESMERVRSALLNSGYRFPRGIVTVNLAPAHIRKEGPVYDLPIAVGILALFGQQIFDVTQAQGEPVTEVHSMRDDLRWKMASTIDGWVLFHGSSMR